MPNDGFAAIPNTPVFLRRVLVADLFIQDAGDTLPLAVLGVWGDFRWERSDLRDYCAVRRIHTSSRISYGIKF